MQLEAVVCKRSPAQPCRSSCAGKRRHLAGHADGSRQCHLQSTLKSPLLAVDRDCTGVLLDRTGAAGLGGERGGACGRAGAVELDAGGHDVVQQGAALH